MIPTNPTNPMDTTKEQGPVMSGDSAEPEQSSAVAPAPATNAARGAVVAVIGLLVGILVGLVLHPSVPLWLQPYLPIAVVAALDAVFGAARATLEHVFVDKVFVISFVGNVLVAALIVFLGDRLGVGAQLSTGVIVVLSVRIFANAAAIRRNLFGA